VSRAAELGITPKKDFGSSYGLHGKDKRLVYRNDETSLKRKEIWDNYQQYIKDAKVSPKNILEKNDLYVVVDRLFEEIERSWLENTAGILLRQFGYFTVLASKRKVKATANMIRTKKHFYYPVFIPFEDDTDWKFFSMDYTIRRRIKTNIIRKAINGFKYKNMLYSLKDYLRMSEKLLRYRDKIRNKKG